MKNWQIRFVGGSCTGKIVPVRVNEPVNIGRSRSNSVVLTEPDVSARHCILKAETDGSVSLEILSSRVTKVDEQTVNISDRVSLHAGQTVFMGKVAAFILEQFDNDDMATQTQENSFAPAGRKSENSSATVQTDAPIASSAPLKDSWDERTVTGKEVDENKTVADATRLASPEEISELKQKYQSKRILKSIVIGVAVLLFFGISGALFFWLRADRESQVVWPEDLKTKKARSALVLRSNVGLVFPSTENYKVSANSIEVNSAFGKKRDIPLHMLAVAWDDPEGLSLSRAEAFHRCMKQMLEKDASLNFDQNEESMFVNTDMKDSAGVLLNYVSYSRRLGNDDVFGYMVYFRYQIQNVFCLIEVPMATQWKTGYYLKSQMPYMFRIANTVTVGHWEGSSDYRKESTVRKDLEDARQALLQKSPGVWSYVSMCVRSALIKSWMANDKAGLDSAKILLLKLRKVQSEWYNTQKLAYLYAKNNGDKNTMQNIQSQCEAAFPCEFQDIDYRYDLLRRKVWK